MKLIALMGLVVVEKIEMLEVLAQAAKTRVVVIDQMRRLHADPARLSGADYIRLEGDLAAELPPLLDDLETDLLLLAVSETTPPDETFVLLDQVHEAHPDLEMHTLALVDTRTCDCFPQTRQSLEASADTVVNLPADFDAVREALWA